MFWRKKKTEGTLFSFDSSCKREYARVSPLPEMPAAAALGKQKTSLVDISAGGMACRCADAAPGQVKPFKLRLSGEQLLISGRAEVIRVSDRGVCHCRFLKLNDEMTEAIHRYVLAVQKLELQKKNTPQ